MQFELYLFIFAVGAISGVAFFRKVREMIASGRCEQTTQTVGSMEMMTDTPAVDISAISEELSSLRHNECILEGTIDDLQLIVSNLRDDLAEKTQLLEDYQNASPNNSNAEPDDVDRAIDFEPFDPASADPQQLFIRNKELSSQVIELEDRLYETQQCLLSKVEQLNEFEKCRHVEIVTPSPLQSITRVDIPLEAVTDLSESMNQFVPTQSNIDSEAPSEVQSLSPLRTIPVEVEDDMDSDSSSDSICDSSNTETMFTKRFETSNLSQTFTECTKQVTTLQISSSQRIGDGLSICRTFGSLDLSDAPPVAPTSTTTDPMSGSWERKESISDSLPVSSVAGNVTQASSVASSRRTSCSSTDNAKYLDSMEDRVAKLKEKMQRMKNIGVERRM
eukprot:TRINITY_DN13947_c0_g1_i1.p1 TRINITY_DN13947_c0_g1~~TRINITY_DN13947_c0_g1_i1.p1  ORF type:complete len:411 (+),score=87.52 TRINITY_DN13947_c0_g1_i1:63-1235(+)